MGTRKELNKYIPPSFDPKKIPRIRKPKNQQKKVRNMLPFRSIRCKTCGNYISGGTKFNSREEQVIGQTYLGLKIHRFYIKCTNCSAELVFRTDPENTGYVVESGAASRTYDQHKGKKLAEEGEDEMLSLEKKASVSKKKIDVMAALDELKSMKARRMSVTVDTMLEALTRRDKQEEEEDALLIKSIRFGRQRKIAEEETGEKKRRLVPTDEKKPKAKKRLTCGKSPIQLSSVSILISKKEKTTSMGLTSLCHNYGTDEEG